MPSKKTIGIKWLEEVRDGSIENYLKDEAYVKKLCLTRNQEKLLNTFRDNHLEGRTPNTKRLEPLLDWNRTKVRYYFHMLEKKELTFDFTIPELVFVFGKFYPGHGYTLDPNLDYATYRDLDKFKRRPGYKSWEKMFKNPRLRKYQRYYVALIEIPLYRRIFGW